MGIIDTHTHYNDEAYDADRAEIISALPDKGVERAVNIAVDIESCLECIELTKTYEHIYAAVGIHPSYVSEVKEAYLDKLREFYKESKVVAIGEIGLDYYWSTEYKDEQKTCFIEQLELAKELDATVVIHSREAAKDTYDIIRDHAKGLRVIMHCYSYSLEMAKEFLKLDTYFGIGGVSTYKNAPKVKEVIEYLPMDRILLETDCPYLSPGPYRGRRNESSYIKYIVDAISELKAFSPGYIIEKTAENARRVYPKLR